MVNSISIHLLQNRNFLILYNKTDKDVYNLYIYNANAYFFITILRAKIFFKLSINIIKLFHVYKHYNTTKLQSLINKFFMTWNTVLYKKITFTGKGYKIVKWKNLIFFFFNAAHVIFLINRNSVLKKIRKNKILFFFKDYNSFNFFFFLNVIKVRYVNLFTKRGLRFSRQLIRKKRGKGSV